MRTLKLLSKTVSLLGLIICLSGCGSRHGEVLPAGDNYSIAEESFTIKTTTSDKDGNLVPHVTTTFAPGSIIKGK